MMHLSKREVVRWGMDHCLRRDIHRIDGKLKYDMELSDAERDRLLADREAVKRKLDGISQDVARSWARENSERLSSAGLGIVAMRIIERGRA